MPDEKTITIITMDGAEELPIRKYQSLISRWYLNELAHDAQLNPAIERKEPPVALALCPDGHVALAVGGQISTHLDIPMVESLIAALSVKVEMLKTSPTPKDVTQ